MDKKSIISPDTTKAWFHNVKIWNTFFFIVLVFYIASTIPVLLHIVTWSDPTWYSYNALDLYNGRERGTNLFIDKYIEENSPQSFLFFGIDLRMNSFWYLILAGFYEIFGVSLFTANLASFVFSVLTVFVVYGIIKEIFGDKILSAQSAILLLLDYQFFWMATMARPDIAAMFFGLLGIYWILVYYRTKKILLPFLASVAWAMGFATHLLMVFFPIIFFIVSQVARFLNKNKRLVAYLYEAWPVILAFVLFGIFTLFYYSYYSQFLDRYLEFAREIFSLSRGIRSEFYVKIWQVFARRYSLQLLVIFFILISVSAIAAFRKQDKKTLSVLTAMLIMSFLGILIDQNPGPPRLLYYSPFFALFTAIGLKEIFPVLRHKIVKAIVLIIIIFSIILPRMGKYYQIFSNWRGTNYNAYISQIKSLIPPNSVIAGDITLIWGLHDYGVKIIDPYCFFENTGWIPFDKKYADLVDYIVVYDKYFTLNDTKESFFNNFHYPIEKIGEFKGKGSYGYKCEIYRKSN